MTGGKNTTAVFLRLFKHGFSRMNTACDKQAHAALHRKCKDIRPVSYNTEHTSAPTADLIGQLLYAAISKHKTSYGNVHIVRPGQHLKAQSPRFSGQRRRQTHLVLPYCAGTRARFYETSLVGKTYRLERSTFAKHSPQSALIPLSPSPSPVAALNITVLAHICQGKTEYFLGMCKDLSIV